MDKFLRFFRHYGLSICVAMTILYVCMMPSPPSPPGKIPFFDKIVHFTMYAVLAFVICKCLYQEYTEVKSFKMIFWAVAAPILFGGLIEIMQAYLTTTRSGEWADLACDAGGTVLGYLIGSYTMPRYFDQNEN